jgi:hypothetical protein
VYYYWVNASFKPDPYLDTKMQIKTIFHAHKGRYGYRRVQSDTRASLSPRKTYFELVHSHKLIRLA